MLSEVIEAFKSWLCFSVHLSQIFVWYEPTGLYISLHSSSARLDGIHPLQIHLIGIWDSPDHCSVCNKEVKFNMNLLSGAECLLSVLRESPYY